MKTIILFLFLTSFTFSQSRIIYLQGLSLQLGEDKSEFMKQAEDNGFEVSDTKNGNYYIRKKIDETLFSGNVRFINNVMVSASKTWGMYSISNSYNALKDYFNLLEKQEENNRLNYIFTQRFTDINIEDFIITNSFGEYKIEITFNKDFIIIVESLSRTRKN